MLVYENDKAHRPTNCEVCGGLDPHPYQHLWPGLKPVAETIAWLCSICTQRADELHRHLVEDMDDYAVEEARSYMLAHLRAPQVRARFKCRGDAETFAGDEYTVDCPFCGRSHMHYATVPLIQLCIAECNENRAYLLVAGESADQSDASAS